jgi:hypothetical protein
MKKIECPTCKTQIDVTVIESSLDFSDTQEVAKRQSALESMICHWPEEHLQMMVDQCERTRNYFMDEIKRRKSAH